MHKTEKGYLFILYTAKPAQKNEKHLKKQIGFSIIVSSVYFSN